MLQIQVPKTCQQDLCVRLDRVATTHSGDAGDQEPRLLAKLVQNTHSLELCYTLQMPHVGLHCIERACHDEVVHVATNADPLIADDPQTGVNQRAPKVQRRATQDPIDASSPCNWASFETWKSLVEPPYHICGLLDFCWWFNVDLFQQVTLQKRICTISKTHRVPFSFGTDEERLNQALQRSGGHRNPLRL